MHLFNKENIWSNPQQFPAYIQTSTIILWTELFPKKRREKIQGEILQSSSNTVVFPHSTRISSNTVYSTVFPHAIQQLQVILHTELILLHEISRKYYNYKAHPVQISTRHLPVTAPVSPSILHSRIRLPASLQHSRATLQHKQASSNSTR